MKLRDLISKEKGAINKITMGIYVTDDKWANEPKENEYICPVCKGNLEQRFECVGKVEKKGLPLTEANIEGYYCPQCEIPIVIAKYPPLPINQSKVEVALPISMRFEE